MPKNPYINSSLDHNIDILLPFLIFFDIFLVVFPFDRITPGTGRFSIGLVSVMSEPVLASLGLAHYSTNYTHLLKLCTYSHGRDYNIFD